ncbi:hypothetical protein [Chromobacterium violaceum]|uniref:Histidine phosphatase family protein n=1 Tax=Chromobacterium violaceum TaxID=536 RepID=A0AAX2M5B3_CHRVL|nr:hypothetical protein [Chromobacterium violaceum]OLZ83828.1 hypothetical protein BS642_05205 [Chromobacterium violaceum]STB71908.1 Uncharacterised protein [Chromobacterium violaceum]SUX31624.1 Uncharacterised protein [Chromobacterium violaceum]
MKTTLLCLALLAAAPAFADSQTLVMLRHGEKPDGGYGQLNCKGLNRSLALIKTLPAKYGKADQIYAPSTASQKRDPAGTFNYIRPLATIEPTAIALGLPVNTAFDMLAIDGLQQQLVNPLRHGKTVYIAWEHKQLQALAADIMRRYGGKDGAAQVPAWGKDDFDSLYVIDIDYGKGKPIARFRHDKQDLNDLPDACPGA